jgi:DNA-binding GntR family transcriptional regulator
MILFPLKELQNKKSISDHVFEHLKLSIIKEDIKPGTRLVESRIAEMLDVSRTPVREAIHKLERGGFVKKLPKAGFIIPELTIEEIEETFGIRAVLEAYAARLAAEKHEEKDLLMLERKIKKYQDCLNHNSENIDELADCNTQFHEVLYSLSKSPKLIKMLKDIGAQIFRFRHLILKQKNMAEKSNEDHRIMLEFIKKKDAESVERVVKKHILGGKEAVLKEVKIKNF